MTDAAVKTGPKSAAAIGREMISASTQPMSKAQSELMIRILMMGDAEVPLNEDDLPLATKIMMKRGVATGVPIESKALLFLSALTNTPGDCMLYLCACKAIHDETGKPITMGDIVNKFPMGFPTEPERHRIWDAQKYRGGGGWSDNSVDYDAAWGATANENKLEIVE